MVKPSGAADSRRPVITTRIANQRGGSLIAVIGIIALMSISLVGLVRLVNSNQKTTTAYRDLRAQRYNGDSAVKQAINWAKDNQDVAIDPLYDPSSDAKCVYRAQMAPGQVVTVSCATTAGSRSGQPAEGGMMPTEALVLTGDRHNEPGPYNNACVSPWDSFLGLFSGTTQANAGSANKEMSLLVRRSQNDQFWSCGQRPRTLSNFKITGKVRAAGKVLVDSPGTITTTGADVRARYGCSPTSLCSPGMDTRADGSQADSDPAINTAAPGFDVRNPFRFMKTAWQAVNFNTDGTLTSGASMPARDTIDSPGRAYVWNPTLQKLELTPQPNCTGTDTSGNPMDKSRTIIFLPGWYRRAATLNQYTQSQSCNEFTMWFAPDGYFDNSTLTRLDGEGRTGAFYFDFRDRNTSGAAIAGTQCESDPAKATRWCIGGQLHNQANRTKVRVVTGTPSGWSPIGAGTAGSGNNQSLQNVEVNVANTVDSGLSIVWSNASGARRIGDGSVADYGPFCLFGICTPSSDRAIRVRDFQPKVTAGPYNGRLYLTIAYGIMNNGSPPMQASVEIAAVGKQSGTKDCGTYALPYLAYSGSGPLPTPYTFSTTQAQQLAAVCGTADLINGLQVTLKVSGNGLNYGTPKPKVWLDGVRFSFTSYQGASFPGTTAIAPSDCDKTAPGAQLIFGGESHVYVADGSLEVCAGSYPTAPKDHMNIGVYGVPSVPPLRPSTVSFTGGTQKGLTCGTAASGSSQSNANRIGEPAGRLNAGYSYGNYSVWPFACGTKDFDGKQFARSTLTFPAYTAPPGYVVKKIEARVGYNSDNPPDILNWAVGSHAHLKVQGLADSTRIEMPFASADTGFANTVGLILYGPGVTTKLPPTGAGNTLANGAVLEYYTRAGWGEYNNDKLDGVELQVTLEQTSTTEPRLTPQAGCILAFPNYSEGQGAPDCAIIRADQRKNGDQYPEDTPILGWFTRNEGDWVGRVSVKGTVYAPSSALDIDDTDAAYSLATRGAVLRHLRVKGFAPRNGYGGAAIDNAAANAPVARDTVFTSCIQSAARQAITPKQACSAEAGDTILTRARVRFAVPYTPNATANVPVVQWWSNGRPDSNLP